MTQIQPSEAAPTGQGTDYERTVRVAASPDVLFDAVTTAAGITAWWTPTTGSGAAGGTLELSFDPPEPCVFHVDEATRPSSVRWSVSACSFLTDWVGTQPVFTFVPIDHATTDVHFRHHGLTSDLDCIDMCSNGWNHFLDSLRAYAETGLGMPRLSPEDEARRQ